MRLALVHNPGSGRHLPLESLLDLLAREGHDVVRVIEQSADLHTLADPPADLVVTAGGDGTVADGVRAIAGRGVPLAVLPLGTANNIAFTLGIHGRLEPLIRSWHDASAQPFDLGILSQNGATGAAAEKPFVEGAGGGLVAACLASFLRRPLQRGEPPPAQLVRALRRYTQTLKQIRPRTWSLRLDDGPLDGDFLLVEVLNTRAVGPNLELAPASNPSDGVFAVVTARETDRPAINAYIADRLAGRDTRLELPVRSSRAVHIGRPPTLHVDDELVRLAAGSSVSLRMHAAAISVLVPPPA